MTFCASLSDLAQALGPTTRSVDIDNAEQTITGINTDTRTLQRGELFVALEGEHFNGHDFVQQAIAAGAIAALTRHDVLTGNFPVIDEDVAGPLERVVKLNLIVGKHNRVEGRYRLRADRLGMVEK